MAMLFRKAIARNQYRARFGIICLICESIPSERKITARPDRASPESTTWTRRVLSSPVLSTHNSAVTTAVARMHPTIIVPTNPTFSVFDFGHLALSVGFALDANVVRSTDIPIWIMWWNRLPGCFTTTSRAWRFFLHRESRLQVGDQSPLDEGVRQFGRHFILPTKKTILRRLVWPQAQAEVKRRWIAVGKKSK